MNQYIKILELQMIMMLSFNIYSFLRSCWCVLKCEMQVTKHQLVDDDDDDDHHHHYAN